MAKPIFSHPAVFRDPPVFTIRGQPLTTSTTYRETFEVVPVSAAAGDITVTLPLASSGRGRVVIFIKTQNANKVFVVPAGSDAIGYGGITVTLINTDDHAQLISDGISRWLTG